VSRYFTLTHQNSFIRLNRQKRTVNLRLKRGPYTTALILIVLISVLSLFFLAQVFQSATSGYQISDLQKQADELKEKNKTLEIKAAELRSFDRIKQEAEKLNMIKSDQIVYLRAKTSMAAAR
jgi:cell division protein FtsB